MKVSSKWYFGGSTRSTHPVCSSNFRCLFSLIPFVGDAICWWWEIRQRAADRPNKSTFRKVCCHTMLVYGRQFATMQCIVPSSQCLLSGFTKNFGINYSASIASRMGDDMAIGMSCPSTVTQGFLYLDSKPRCIEIVGYFRLDRAYFLVTDYFIQIDFILAKETCADTCSMSNTGTKWNSRLACH